MNIAIVVGHSILKNGNITSAGGVVNEYRYNKELAPIVVKYLRELGHKVDLIICPEKKFIKATEESTYKLNLIKKANYDLIVELHLNASDNTSAKGCEVLYKSKKGGEYAQRVQKKLSTVFTDRGIKKRDNLYMLNQPSPVSIIIESFFCTSATDCKLGADKDKIARLIAEGIAGKNIAEKKEPEKVIYRVQVGAFSDRNNANATRTRLNSLGYNAIVVANKV